jgi:hypothetical protein
MSLIKSGRFWMIVWLTIGGAFTAWAVATVLFLLDSVRNLSLMSVAALLVAVAAGIQTTLTMRKADQDDDF